MKKKPLDYFVLFISILVLVLFVYGLIKISFQTGDNSARITQTIAYKLGALALKEQPSQEQITAINATIRYGAHIGLFAMLGYLIGIVLFMLNSRTTLRMIGIILDWAVTFGLSYYTEYYKMYIRGRHFQLSDVRANMAGSLFGIIFFLVSYVLFYTINNRTRKKKEMTK